ncbi:hypothetical protein BDR22DRAFT_865794 [Usnea florida]
MMDDGGKGAWRGRCVRVWMKWSRILLIYLLLCLKVANSPSITYTSIIFLTHTRPTFPYISPVPQLPPAFSSSLLSSPHLHLRLYLKTLETTSYNS